MPCPHRQVLTVTRNVNTCSTIILEEHRLQASEFLASYIKVLRRDGSILQGFTERLGSKRL